MGARETIERLSKSQWPPSPASVLNGVLTLVAAIAVSVVSWLAMSQISSQVLQAQNAQAIQTAQAAVAEVSKKGDDLAKHNRKIDETQHGINLTLQRLTDMVARHDADIDELREDARDDRRRARRDRD